MSTESCVHTILLRPIPRFKMGLPDAYHLSVYQARATCAAVALGEGMSQKPAQPPFAWWITPATRALRTPVTQPAAGLQRRPFSRPNVATQPRVSSALPSAEIFLFTGSNTPYESHE